MSSLYQEMCNKVSKCYHARIKEVLSVIDPKLIYTVKHTRNTAMLKDLVRTATKDNGGYKHISSTVTSLSGKVVTYPAYRIEGDFVVVVVKNRMRNPQSGEIKNNNFIFTYEKAEDYAQRIGGIVNAGLHR